MLYKCLRCNDIKTSEQMAGINDAMPHWGMCYQCINKETQGNIKMPETYYQMYVEYYKAMNEYYRALTNYYEAYNNWLNGQGLTVQ